METRMELTLLAVNDFLNGTNLLVVLALIGMLVFGLLALVFFSFLNLWLQAFLTGARVGFFDLVAMKFRKVDYSMLVRQKIALVQAGVKVGNDELEAHYLARGNVPKVATAVIAAHKAGIDLPWRIAALKSGTRFLAYFPTTQFKKFAVGR